MKKKERKKESKKARKQESKKARKQERKHQDNISDEPMGARACQDQTLSYCKEAIF